MRKFERIQRMAAKVPEQEDLTYKEKKKGLLIPEERGERGDLITTYKLTNDLEEMDSKDLLLKRERETGYLRGHKKN